MITEDYTTLNIKENGKMLTNAKNIQLIVQLQITITAKELKGTLLLNIKNYYV